MMENYDQSVEKNHNPNWPYIPEPPYRILIVGVPESGKCVIEINKKSLSMTRYWQNLLICQRSIWIKVSIAY